MKNGVPGGAERAAAKIKRIDAYERIEKRVLAGKRKNFKSEVS